MNESPIDLVSAAKSARKRLAYLRHEIKAERISCGEIAELKSLIPFIPKDDVLLLEWAGVPEDQYRRMNGIK